MSKSSFNIKAFFKISIIVLLYAIGIFVIVDKLSISILKQKKSFIEQQFATKDIRKPEPYIMFKGAPLGKAWKKYSEKTGLTDNILNEIGYPGEIPAIPKPNNEYRVIVLGGSTVFMGNPAIPRLIQYQFEKKQCKDVKVYNFGVVSSVTSMELARLVFEVVNYDPDLIISYSGFNDINQPLISDPRPGYPFNYFITESNPILESDINDYPLSTLIAYGSNIMRYFAPQFFLEKFSKLEQLKENAQWNTEGWREQIANIYIDNLIKSRKIAHAFDIHFMAFLQPALPFKDKVSAHEEKSLTETNQSHSLEIRELILQRAKEEKKAGRLNLINMTDFFDNIEKTVFTDIVHILPEYKPRTATKIYRYVLSFIQKNDAEKISNAVCIE